MKIISLVNIVPRIMDIDRGGRPSRKAQRVSTGLASGFFNKPTTIDLTHLNNTPPSDLVMEEVQTAMSPPWMTPSLLDSVGESTELIEAMKDHSFIQFLELSKSNPTKARELLEHNKTFQKHFTAFSRLLGNHFQDLSPVDKIDHAVQEALDDPDIKQILSCIKSGQMVDPRVIGAQFPRLKHKLDTLINAGLLNITV